MVRIYIISLPILVAGMVVYRTNRFYFPTGGIEFPIFLGNHSGRPSAVGPRPLDLLVQSKRN